MKVSFLWENLEHPVLKKLRENYQLEKVIQAGHDEAILAFL